jgi:integrase
MKNPGKPYKDFPLTPCGNGQWRKIVDKKPYYFGSWRSDLKGEAALKEWVSRRDAIHAGLDRITAPVAEAGGKTVIELIRWYLAIRSADVIHNRRSPLTYNDYVTNLNDFGKFIGPTAKASALKPSHFAKYRATLDQRKLGPHAVKRVTANIKAMFNYAMDEEEITPIRFGRQFVTPRTDDASLAQHYERAGKENRTETTLTRKQFRKLMKATRENPLWRAMVLVMLNTGMNPAELARLKWAEINFKSGRLSRRRGKKGIRHEVYLWKITRAALEKLPRSEVWVFLRANGQQFVHCKTDVVQGVGVVKVHRSNRISRPFRDLAEAAGVPGITPYTLRRTTRTMAAHCRDDNAAKRMMGQALSGQDTTYVKGKFPMARLKRVSLAILRRLQRKVGVKPGQLKLAS